MHFTFCIDEAGRHKAAFKSWAARFPSHLIKPCHLFSNHSHVSCLIYGGVSSAVIHLSFSALHCFYNPPPTLHLHLDAGPSSIKSLDRKSHQVVKVHSSSSSTHRCSLWQAPGEFFSSKSLLAWFKGNFIYSIMSSIMPFLFSIFPLNFMYLLMLQYFVLICQYFGKNL